MLTDNSDLKKLLAEIALLREENKSLKACIAANEAAQSMTTTDQLTSTTFAEGRNNLQLGDCSVISIMSDALYNILSITSEELYESADAAKNTSSAIWNIHSIVRQVVQQVRNKSKSTAAYEILLRSDGISPRTAAELLELKQQLDVIHTLSKNN
jgi:hypothetical protein